MRTSAPSRSAPSVFVVGGLALLLLLVPYPGSLSVVLYESIALTMQHVPGIGAAGVAGIVALAALLGGVLVRAWRRDPVRFDRGAAAAVGVPVAYLVSEGLKLLFAQERPCRVVADLAECPPVGDWSLPSNHSTVAFALFCAIAVTRRGRLPWLAAGLAVLAGWSRVAEGVHYPHDVAAGALVGLGIVGAAAALLTLPVGRATRWIRAHRGPAAGRNTARE